MTTMTLRTKRSRKPFTYDEGRYHTKEISAREDPDMSEVFFSRFKLNFFLELIWHRIEFKRK